MQVLRTALVRLSTSEGWLGFTRRVAEIRRRLMLRPRVVRVFLELDDPYSYILSCYLASLERSLDFELEIYLTAALDGAYRPAPGMLAEYAVDDCRRLANELGIPFLDTGASPPVEHRLTLLDALASQERTQDAGGEIVHALEMYWRGDSEGVARRVVGVDARGAADKLLARNSRRLQRLGHYNTATINYGGEWYWGVDRLLYLVERLEAEGARRTARRDARLASLSQVIRLDLPIAPPNAAKRLAPLEFFFSFRSPYSYIAARPVIEIADAFGLDLVIRPVLPMVMRSMPVPRRKLAYILFDASREARRRGIPFGRIADPLGAGVERCHAVFACAQDARLERSFILAASEAIWARGIDLATDEGMRDVADRAGLSWPDAVEAMQRTNWRDAAEENRASMTASGSWGVPTLRIGDFLVWGQDRDWLLVRHLEKLCDTGEGIMV